MPAHDLYHNTVKAALEKDNWKITNDPLTLQYGGKDLFVDLGAKKILAAEKYGEKIAVEIKTFLGRSAMYELEKAVGQYIVYRNILEEVENDRTLYLAIPKIAYKEVFEERLGNLILTKNKLRLLVFDPSNQEVVTWIH
ncbi:element excision factor XisH family protein [Roseofilum sp. BLCC_M154]|uniref:Element excision factor XisH family protein n=2 Tax=Roseofilum TaxID=1233426 RepID=A0ABT7ARW7_9CYAN|nr:element excision factor XisH family protein [Roseofilum acuticapitatum BLCC-M154]